MREENSHKMLCLQFFPLFPTYYQKPMNAGKQMSPQKREYIPPQEFTPDCEPSPLKAQIDDTYSTKPISHTKNAKKVEELKKRVRVLKEIIQKKNKKISTLKDIVQSLKENKLVIETKHDLLE